MTELEKAMHDMRRDFIHEVADSMPDATGAQLVRAVVDQLDAWRPQLVEIDVHTGRTIVTLEMTEDTAHLAMLAIDDAREKRHADDHVDEMLSELSHRIGAELNERLSASAKVKDGQIIARCRSRPGELELGQLLKKEKP